MQNPTETQTDTHKHTPTKKRTKKYCAAAQRQLNHCQGRRWWKTAALYGACGHLTNTVACTALKKKHTSSVSSQPLLGLCHFQERSEKDIYIVLHWKHNKIQPYSVEAWTSLPSKTQGLLCRSN